MLRTTSPNHDSNLFTEGNPAGGIPATTLGSSDANSWQEEIVNAILGAGITLASDLTQLRDAIQTIAGLGGVQIDQAVLNNQVADVDIVGLVFDKAVTKAARILYEVERSTLTPTNLNEVGEIFVAWDSVNDAWKISTQTNMDDAGMSFAVDGSGQVSYQSSNIAGGSYAGHFRASITKINL